jgi:hypothetical protein
LDDEPLISKAANRPATSVSKVKTEEGLTTVAGGYHETISLTNAMYSKIPLIDLTDNPEDAVGAKITTHDHQSLENARGVLLSQFMRSATSPARSMSLSSTTTPHIAPNLPMTPTATLTLTPQPAQLASSNVKGGTLWEINNSTTLIFFDSHNKELRRRTFEDVGGRLNVSTLFGQAIRAGLIEKSDEDAILSVSIRGFREDFKVLRDDKPDFARLMGSIAAAGLCMVEVRLD